MARRIPENRFDQLIRGATEVFIARGYRLTQMSDVAKEVGVAKGTLYGYVESKDSLLALCLIHADEVTPIRLPEVLPVPGLPPGEMGRLIAETLEARFDLPALLDRARVKGTGDPELELRAVIADLFDLMFANRHAIKLLDGCSDHSEIHDVWQKGGRDPSRTVMARYLDRRGSAGELRAFDDVRIAARFLIETITTWAVHIHWDRSPEPLEPAQSREAVIDFLVRGFALSSRTSEN